LRSLDATGVDAIALVRGGGSLEDLWAFNELAVAEAIWNASVPVVSGIGHQTDTTLADLVADHRAHTPTDAAQTVIPERAQLCARIARLGNYLIEAMERHGAARAERLNALTSRPVLRDADWILGQRLRSLAQARARLGSALQAGLERRATQLSRSGARLERRSPRLELARRERRLSELGVALSRALERLAERTSNRLALSARALEAVSPLAVLSRGYSLTRRADGSALRDAAALAPGEEVETRLARGSFIARVESVHPAPADGEVSA